MQSPRSAHGEESSFVNTQDISNPNNGQHDTVKFDSPVKKVPAADIYIKTDEAPEEEKKSPLKNQLLIVDSKSVSDNRTNNSVAAKTKKIQINKKGAANSNATQKGAPQFSSSHIAQSTLSSNMSKGPSEHKPAKTKQQQMQYNQAERLSGHMRLRKQIEEAKRQRKK